MENLKPCPFCGSSDDDIDPKFSATKAVKSNTITYHPGCMKCGANTETIEMWNSRAEKDMSIERVHMQHELGELIREYRNSLNIFEILGILEHAKLNMETIFYGTEATPNPQGEEER